MIKINCFKAGKGDSFLLTWDDGHNLLIDAGIEGTYRFIRPRISEAGKLDAILITHVDYDHIGGFFKLLQDDLIPDFSKLRVYINTPNLYLTSSESDLVGLEHGIEFEQALKSKGITPIGLYLDKDASNTESLFGLTLRILSPEKLVLEKLLSEWSANEVYLKYHQKLNSEDSMVSNTSTNTLTPIEEILAAPPKPKDWQGDLLNSSSISFIAGYKRINLLFLGDGHPELIYNQLTEIGYSKENPLKADLVKISHHGSKHNTTRKLLELLNCNKYLISTDGTKPYRHPNRETLVLISEYGRQNKSIPLIIYTNYPLDVCGILTEDEVLELKITFVETELIEFETYE